MTTATTPSGSSVLLLESDLQHLLREGESRYGLLVEHDAGHTLAPVVNGRVLREGLDPGQPRSTLFSPEGLLLVHCILQKADTLNRNGRVYPRAILEREDRNYQTLINERMSSGEVNHPETITLDLHNLGHLITKTWWDGVALMGQLEILVSDPYVRDGSIHMPGDKIAFYLERRMKLGISSRGLGSVRKVGGQLIVQPDFSMVAYDLVQSPSTPGSYLVPADGRSGTLRESYQPLVSAQAQRVSHFGAKRG